MEYKLEYYAKEYKHGWTVWLTRDGQKFQLGSGIKTENEVSELVRSIGLAKEHLSVKTKLEYALEDIEKLKEDNNTMKNALMSMGAGVIGK